MHTYIHITQFGSVPLYLTRFFVLFFCPTGRACNTLVQDALQAAGWEEEDADLLHDPAFAASLRHAQECVATSSNVGTLSRYESHWARFTAWCGRFRLRCIPARPQHIAMFLADTLRYAQLNRFGYSVVKAASAAIFHAHKLAGFESGFTDHPFVSRIRECAKRILGTRPWNRKEPLSLDLCVTCALQLIAGDDSLARWQIATFIMTCFAGFLRYSDATRIYADEIRFFDTHMELFIETRKNLQFRQGDVVCIARGTSLACPVYLMESLLDRAGLRGRHVPVFRQASYSRGDYSVVSDTTWDYKQAQRLVLQALARTAGVGYAEFKWHFGLHSLRSGGASYVAAAGVPDHIFQAHGAWATAEAMHNYIQRSMANKLLPTRVMPY